MRTFLLMILLVVANISYASSDQIRGIKVTNLSTYDNFAVVYFSPEFTNSQGCPLMSAFSMISRFFDQ